MIRCVFMIRYLLKMKKEVRRNIQKIRGDAKEKGIK